MCGKCNNLLGQFVDGEFQRSFFTSVEESSAALAFLDTSRAIALPLVYMGTLADEPPDGEVCESWIGPRGERIYFLHAKDRDDFASYAGGDPIKRSMTDGGRVYMSFSEPNAYWIHTAAKSAREKFRHAEFRLLTIVNDPVLLGMCSQESDESVKDRAFLDAYWRVKTNHVHQTMSLDHGVRFQCKLALSFGNTLFGDGSRQPFMNLSCGRRCGNATRERGRRFRFSARRLSRVSAMAMSSCWDIPAHTHFHSFGRVTLPW